MILSDRDLLAAINTDRLSIFPFDESAVQPSTIDLRLSQYFRVFDNSKYTHIDPRESQDDLTTLIDVESRPFILHPGEFVLGSTHEKIQIGNDVAARVEGKSSNGRLGIQVHSTAGVIDPGFQGNITLELSNVARLPVILQPGMWIAQLTVIEMTSSARRPYGHRELNSKYQDQIGPAVSKSCLNYS
jgi:dCTP deaminase